MTNEEAREILTSIEIQSYRDVSKRWFFTDVNEAFGIAIKALQKQQQENNFYEVLDFFNDIMHTIDVAALGESKDNVRFARSIVYKVFARRYKIKELERNGKK